MKIKYRVRTLEKNKTGLKMDYTILSNGNTITVSCRYSLKRDKVMSNGSIELNGENLGHSKLEKTMIEHRMIRDADHLRKLIDCIFTNKINPKVEEYKKEMCG